MSVELFGFDAFLKKLEDLKRKAESAGRAAHAGDRCVAVGILGKSDSDLVIIAASNEYGTSNGHIPSRPFLRTALRDKALVTFVQGQAAAYYKGTVELDQALGRIGAFMTGLIQKSIVNGPWQPNAESTIARKGSSRPLIDTGRMRQSITWEVR